MKMFIVLPLLAFSASAFAQAPVAPLPAPTAYGHVWGSYSEDNLSLDQAVIGLSEKFDDTVSGDVSLITNDKGQAVIHSAFVKAKNLFTTDSLTVGLQGQSYVAHMEAALGTRWLAPTFAEAAGVLPESDAGATYALGVGPVSLDIHARNDVPNDKHQTYGALLSASPASWLEVVLEGEQSSLTKDRTMNAALLFKGYSAVYAIEAAQQVPDDSSVDTRTSYGATLTYGFTPKVGVYAQYLTGDKPYQTAAGFKDEGQAGPTYAYSSHLSVALLYHAVDPIGDADRKDGVTLRGAVTF